MINVAIIIKKETGIHNCCDINSVNKSNAVNKQVEGVNKQTDVVISLKNKQYFLNILGVFSLTF